GAAARREYVGPAGVAGAGPGRRAMYRTLAEAAASADAEMPYRLRNLLTIAAGQRVSELELLRRAPIRTSGIAMNKALERVSNALAIGARATQVQAIPAN